ncbi:MAG: class IV adenylate cyclase [Candidatus Woesearchaeota archaeon]
MNTMEIEIKFKVDEPKKVILKAQQIGFNIEKKKHQIDYYYVVNKITNDGERTYFRVRNNPDSTTWSVDLHTIVSEFATDEIEIGTNKDIQKILKYLGHNIVCIVDKQRTILKKDDVLICIDEVQNLGNFVELEIEGTQNDFAILQTLAKELCLDLQNRVSKKGYPDLLMELK